MAGLCGYLRNLKRKETSVLPVLPPAKTERWVYMAEGRRSGSQSTWRMHTAHKWSGCSLAANPSAVLVDNKPVYYLLAARSIAPFLSSVQRGSECGPVHFPEPTRSVCVRECV